MADITTLTADASPGSDSVFYTVDDPAGTPVDRKVTIANLFASAANIGASTIVTVGTITSGTWNGTAIDLSTYATGALATATVPAAQVTAGTFGSGAYVFDSTVSGITTLTATTLAGTLSTATQNSVTTMTGLVTVGALNSGSITSGFGNIDIGSSTITTTGAATVGTLTANAAQAVIRAEGSSAGRLQLGDTGATTSERNFTIYSDGGSLKFDLVDDAWSTGLSTLATVSAANAWDFQSGTITTTGQVNTGVLLGGTTTVTGTEAFATQGQAAAATNWSMFTGDGDGGDAAQVLVYAKGAPGSVTNHERLHVGYTPTGTTFHLHTAAGGTGTVRPLTIYTGSNTDQLLLNIDGTINTLGDLTVGGNLELGAGTITTTGAGNFGSLAVTGAATFGNAGVTHAYVNSNDGFFFNTDANNSGGDGKIVFGTNRTADTGGTDFLVISNLGAFDFQSGSITTTGALASGNATIDGTVTVTNTGGIKQSVDNLYLTITGATSGANGAAILLSGSGYVSASNIFLDSVDLIRRGVNGVGSYGNWDSSGLTVTGTAAVSSTLGVLSGGVDASTGVRVVGTGLTGTEQYGVVGAPTSSSAATVSSTGVYANPATAAAAYTQTNMYGVFVNAGAKGAGSTITNQYGLKIENQALGSTLNYAIYTGTGLVRFGDAVTVSDTTATALTVNSTGANGHYIAMQQSGTSKALIGFGTTMLTTGAAGFRMGSGVPFGIGMNSASESFYIDTSGKVGIGTTSPATTLDVSGTVRSTANATPTSGVGLEMLYISGNNTGYVYAYDRDTPGYKDLLLNNSVTIDTSGNVGIGTTSPTSGAGLTLHISKDTSSALRLSETGESKDWDITASGGLLAIGEASGTTSFRLDSGGSAYIGDTANANMTVGLTINGGSNDNEHFCIKNSDIAHGITTLSETDTFFHISKINPTDGAALVRGYSEQTWGLYLSGVGSVVNTTKTTAANAPIVCQGGIKSGTTQAAPSSNGNVWAVIDGGGTAQFLVDVEGDYHYNGADGGAFDQYDDNALLRTFAVATSDPATIIRNEFDDFLIRNDDILCEIGVLGAPVSEGGLVNGAQLNRVMVGAIGQNHTEIRRTKNEVEQLRSELDATKLELAEAQSTLKQLTTGQA